MAPTVASFSSRGPNPLSPDILKPDITAPDVDILAGWSPLAPSTVSDLDTRTTLFNIISGTSMSCPHASAAAAYVKSFHPDWSPAAIKSALMTTAHVMDPSKTEDREFAYGSGQINPVAAADPGLVFDASEVDYVDFLCKTGYDASTLKIVTGDNSSCDGVSAGRAWDLNYPSYSLYIEDGQQVSGNFTRRATNVGDANSTYSAFLYMPELFTATVEPSILTFSAVGETLTFVVTVTGPTISQQPITSGTIFWADGTHIVRTPLVVYNYLPGAPTISEMLRFLLLLRLSSVLRCTRKSKALHIANQFRSCLKKTSRMRWQHQVFMLNCTNNDPSLENESLNAAPPGVFMLSSISCYKNMNKKC